VKAAIVNKIWDSKARREIFSETHIIGHAHGNNDIAKDTPNIPDLQVMSLDNWEQTCVVVHTAMLLHSKTAILASPSKV